MVELRQFLCDVDEVCGRLTFCLFYDEVDSCGEVILYVLMS